MNRRSALIALCAVATLPRVARSQSTVRTIGLLWIEAAKPSPYIVPLTEGLRAQGHALERTVRLDERFLVTEYADLTNAARALVAAKPDVIVTLGGTAVRAARDATTTIPIVMVGGGNPVRIGVVKSLAKPGGNVTGVSLMSADLSGKRLEILKESSPTARRIAIVLYPQSAVEVDSLRNYEVAARAIGIQTRAVEVQTAADISKIIAGIPAMQVDAIAFVGSTLFRANRRDIAAAVAKTRLSAIYVDETFTEAGGLLSYGPSISDHFRRAGFYIDRILKGAKPEDLPIEQPTRLELVVNARTAKAQGIALPRSLLQRADRVIE